MAMKITDECTGCGVCEAECSREAISEGEDIYIINPDLCTECIDEGGPQCAEVCPVECVEKDPDHQESEDQLREKSKRLDNA